MSRHLRHMASLVRPVYTAQRFRTAYYFQRTAVGLPYRAIESMHNDMQESGLLLRSWVHRRELLSTG
jgi:hypothetical protein